MNIIFYSLVFVLGTIIGSFLNVVILRFHTGRGVTGRSGCFSCGNTLSWYELIPVLSFLLQGGKCRKCKAQISWQYPIVELLSGCIFLLLTFHSGIVSNSSLQVVLSLILDYVIWSVLIVITVYDLKHMIIPDAFSIIFALVSLLKIGVLFLVAGISVATILSYGISAIVLSGFFATLWLVSGGRWIGLGDSKLAVGMGLYLGLSAGLSAFAYAFWIGAVVALLQLWRQKVVRNKAFHVGEKTITMKSEIPFAPFLVLGTLLAFLFQSDVFHIISLFS